MLSLSFCCAASQPLRELRPELALGNRQNVADLHQPPQAARVVVEPIGLLVVPKLKELVDLKLVRLQHLELVDLGLQLVGDLEELDRSPVRRQQRSPLRCRAAGGDGECVFLALGPFLVQVVAESPCDIPSCGSSAGRSAATTTPCCGPATTTSRSAAPSGHSRGCRACRRSASRKASRFSGSSFKNPSTAATSSAIWSGSALSMSLIVYSMDFFGIALNRSRPTSKLASSTLVFQAVLVHDRREREGPHDRLRVVVQHPAPRLVGLFDLALQMGENFAGLRCGPGGEQVFDLLQPLVVLDARRRISPPFSFLNGFTLSVAPRTIL